MEDSVEFLGYEDKASRLELFVLPFYMIPVAFILFFYSAVAFLCLCLQWFVILLLGKRAEGLNGLIKDYVIYIVQLIGYSCLLTSKRPGIFPKKLRFYVQEILLD
jgi:hypothetical protein